MRYLETRLSLLLSEDSQLQVSQTMDLRDKTLSFSAFLIKKLYILELKRDCSV
jgi:hypothetical protein